MNAVPRIIIAGGAGFLGQALAGHLKKRGWDVAVLTRRRGSDGMVGRPVFWDGATLNSWQTELDGATALINLTGKSVNCRYHARNRHAILHSRLNSTRVLGEAIGRCRQPPRVWLNAGTATIYQHTFDAPWDEAGKVAATREAKDAFSIEVAKAWEAAFEQAEATGTRKVIMRTAMVLGAGKNSVFPVLRRLVRLGLGGKMGSGRQFVSWIHANDFCRAVEWLIAHEEISGRVNVVAPNPLPNWEMMRILRRLYGMPFGLPATEWMLEAGAFFLRTETELIIKSRRVVPRRLLEAGFEFGFPTITEAFKDLRGPASLAENRSITHTTKTQTL